MKNHETKFRCVRVARPNDVTHRWRLMPSVGENSSCPRRCEKAGVVTQRPPVKHAGAQLYTVVRTISRIQTKSKPAAVVLYRLIKLDERTRDITTCYFRYQTSNRAPPVVPRRSTLRRHNDKSAIECCSTLNAAVQPHHY